MNADNGMKNWMPFASLPEYKECLNKSLIERKKVTKPLISEDQKEEINRILISLNKGDEVCVSYFQDGFIRKKSSILINVDPYDRKITLIDFSVRISDVMALEKKS